MTTYMGDSAASYIHTVQHLIERCMLFHMNQDECVQALFKHANINPAITATVWQGLEKENKDFFREYERRREEYLSTVGGMPPPCGSQARCWRVSEQQRVSDGSSQRHQGS